MRKVYLDSVIRVLRANSRRWNTVAGGLILAAILAALLALPVACGSSQGDRPKADNKERTGSAPEPVSPIEAVQVAYKKTAEESARVESTNVFTGPATDDAGSGQPPGTSFRIETRGTVDFVDGTGQFVVRMPQPIGAVEVRQVGNVVYQKVPEQLGSHSPGQKPWTSIDLDVLAREQFGASFSQMQGSAPSNPVDQLGYLRGVSDSVDEVGKEEVRGVPTTRYRAKIDLGKAVEGQDEAARRAYEQVEKQIGTYKVPVEVWLDREGLVRRFEMSVPLPIPAPQGGTSAKGAMRLSEEFYDFGVPVNVEPPPADQTADVTEMVVRQTPRP